MKKIFVIFSALFIAAACKGPGGDVQPSLKVNPAGLTFEAVNAKTQPVTVESGGLKWDYKIEADDESWLSVDKVDENSLSVTVRNNTGATQRTASLIIKAADDSSVKPVTVILVQKGAGRSVSFTPAVLVFEGKGASSQKVSVTDEGLAWKTEIDGNGRDWITVTETAGGFSVSVTDNGGTDERSAIITVLATDGTANPKAILVTQAAMPSLTLKYHNGTELPEEGLVFPAHDIDSIAYIYATSVNLQWNVEVEYDSDDSGWISIGVNSDLNTVSFRMNEENNSSEPRTARAIFSTDTAEVGPFEIKITQEPAPQPL